MKIAFVVGNFPAVSETFILNQITGLIDLGHEVEIFAAADPGEPRVHADVYRYGLMDRVHYFGVPGSKAARGLKGLRHLAVSGIRQPLVTARALDAFSFGKAALSLRLLYLAAQFAGREFDIIQCHFGAIGSLAACLVDAGVPGRLVTMFHGLDIRDGLRRGGAIYSHLFKRGDCFLAISDYNYSSLIQMGADPRKVIGHPVGIDMRLCPFRWTGAEPARPDPVVIVSVGRLAEEKGFLHGLRAVRMLLDRQPDLDVEYRIIGHGPLEASLKQQVLTSNLKQVVRFRGAMTHGQVMEELARAHIFMLPSVAEVLPVALMEAQAVGLPTVASDVGSVTQIVDDGQTGFIVPPGEPEALAEKLLWLCRHPEEWPAMGRRGKTLVEERYDIQMLNQRLESVYRDLIG